MKSMMPRLRKPGASHPHLKRTKMSVTGKSAYGHTGVSGGAFPTMPGGGDAGLPAFPMAPQGAPPGAPSPEAPPMAGAGG